MEYKNYFEKIRNDFLSALTKSHEIQDLVLKDIINKNILSEYGKKYRFSDVKTVEDYQNNVPITTYDDYIPYINKILNGEKNILTSEDIILLEPTSGSSSASKLIPYTKGLKKAFNEGINVWLSDLFLNYPEIMRQPMYWSITPSINFQNINSKIRIGFNNDIEYLDGIFAKIISDNIIFPPKISQNTEEFQQQTADFLALHRDLGFISVWNPYLLILFIEKLKDKPKEICNNLQLISCWDESNSKIYADRLKEHFPNVKIQGKGLLATEAIMTIPIESIGKIPCIKSHFFEYLEVETGKIKLIDELETGKDYSIIITTQGGLYRYKIGDIVNVYDKFKNCPLISFKGRENNISDYFGEKLNEDFINTILKNLNINNLAKFYLFAPYNTENGFCYVLYIEPVKDINFSKLQNNIEMELEKSFHYKYARQLGQLGKIKICKVQDGMKQYIEICRKKGQRIGDIKPKTFTNCTDYIFVGKFIV